MARYGFPVVARCRYPTQRRPGRVAARGELESRVAIPMQIDRQGCIDAQTRDQCIAFDQLGIDVDGAAFRQQGRPGPSGWPRNSDGHSFFGSGWSAKTTTVVWGLVRTTASPAQPPQCLSRTPRAAYDEKEPSAGRRREALPVAEAVEGVFTENMLVAKRARHATRFLLGIQISFCADEEGSLSLPGMRDLRGSMTGCQAIFPIAV